MKTNKKPTKKVRPPLAAAQPQPEQVQDNCNQTSPYDFAVPPPPPQPRLVVLAEKIVDIQRTREFTQDRKDDLLQEIDSMKNRLVEYDSRLQALNIQQLEHQNELDRFASLK